MSFESNRVDWVRSLQKIRLQDGLFQNWLERPSRASFAPLFRQNQNFENATNMSFRSNGVDWVRFLRKIQRQDFVFQKSLERPSQTYVATFYGRKPKLRKRNKHKFWVKRGELGAFIAQNSIARLFVPNLARTALPCEFRIVVPSKTETLKTQQT
jgi:hypothetical protein